MGLGNRFFTTPYLCVFLTNKNRIHLFVALLFLIVLLVLIMFILLSISRHISSDLFGKSPSNMSHTSFFIPSCVSFYKMLYIYIFVLQDNGCIIVCWSRYFFIFRDGHFLSGKQKHCIFILHFRFILLLNTGNRQTLKKSQNEW